jgi:hypothetical protein
MPPSKLSDDPADWADRSALFGWPLWQSLRDPYAYSEDGGRTYWLLAERQAASPGRPPTYRTRRAAAASRAGDCRKD